MNAKLIRQHVVFPCKATDREQALFCVLKLGGIETQRVKAGLNPALRLGQFSHRPFKGGQWRLKLAFGLTCSAVEPTQRIAHRALGAFVSKRIERLCDVIADLFGRLHQTAFGIQFRLFAGLRIQLIQFDNRVAQKLFFCFGFVDFCLRCFQRLACNRPIAPGCSAICDQV